MKRRLELLESLLSALTREWGHEEVRQALERLHEGPIPSTGLGHISGSYRRHRPAGSLVKENAKSTAVDMVLRLAIPESKKLPLLELASSYDRKAFLPTHADISYFLEMKGRDFFGIKNRSEAFRKIVDTLLEEPSENLALLVKRHRYHGPSRLGPLSDAIGIASAGRLGQRPQSGEERSHDRDINAGGDRDGPGDVDKVEKKT